MLKYVLDIHNQYEISRFQPNLSKYLHRCNALYQIERSRFIHMKSMHGFQSIAPSDHQGAECGRLVSPSPSYV